MWWYAGSYTSPETFDVSEMITQIKERREAKKELPKEYDIEVGEVYYKDILIEGVDLATFEYIGGSYSKDKNYVYQYSKVVEGVDPIDCTVDNLDGCKASVELFSYVNPVHEYSFSYTGDMQLIAAGHIPSELTDRGVTSMEDLGMSDGDSFLIVSLENEDSVVYTILELSSRSGYTTFEEYIDAMFENLDESEITYTTNKSIVGEGIVSTEVFFKMDVDVRTGVFHDNVFETEGKVFSVSFGYPEGLENTEELLDKYQTLLSSFKGEND